jgi:ADP-heptose:LPS heptosyltransferase
MPKNILIYRSGSIGDTFVAIPTILEILKRNQNAKFTLMSIKDDNLFVSAATVLNDFGWFNKYITYSSKDIKSVFALYKLILNIRNEKYSCVYYINSDKNPLIKILRDKLLFLFVCGITKFLSCPSTHLNFFGRANKKVKLFQKESNRIYHCFFNDKESENLVFDIPITLNHKKFISLTLDNSGLDLSRPLIAMCPGSKKLITRWPIENYQLLGEKILKHTDANIVVIGGEFESNLAKNYFSSWDNGRWLNCASTLSILETSELLRRCVFYLGNDTGPMHIAAAVQTRCVAIFSASIPPRTWYPSGENNIILRRNVSCQNCFLQECNKEELRCLREISVQDVFDASIRALVYK